MDIIDDGIGFNIREFSLNQLQIEPTIVILAKRGSGKSFLAKHLVHFFRNYPGGIIISETEGQNGEFAKIFPDLFIYNECTAEIFDEIIKRQKKAIKKSKEYYEKGKKLDPRLFVIMDDCLANKAVWKNSVGLRTIFLNGRHLFITLVIIIQDPMGIPPDFRGNLDYKFLLADDNFANREKIFKNYAGIFPNYATFSEVYTELTKDYGCMVIVNKGSNASILDKVFRFRAKDVKFSEKACSPNFNSYHELNFNENWEDEAVMNPDEYIKDIAKKKGKLKINLIPQK